jgi:hypothetical protein
MTIRSQGILEAQPGWRVISFDGGAICPDARRLFRTPVIAWHVLVFERQEYDFAASVVPITIEGEVNDMYALQFQDEPQFFTEHETFESEAALLKYFREQSGKSAHA